MNDWLDITRPMDDTLVTWPGRARPARRWEKQIASGDHCNVSVWELSAHSGTHMDAPLHFVAGGQSIDQIPPAIFIGDCQVVDLSAPGATPWSEVAGKAYAGATRLLLKTRPHADGPAYEPHGPLLTETAARLLVAAGLRLLGTDRLSVDDSQGQSFALHQVLLGAGCVIVEGLRLHSVAAGEYELYAAPLRFSGAEASPIRALVRKPSPSSSSSSSSS